MGLRHLLFYILTYMSGTVSDTRGPQISRHSSCPHITHRCSRWMVTWTGISDKVKCSTEKLRVLRGANRRQIQPSLNVVRKQGSGKSGYLDLNSDPSALSTVWAPLVSAQDHDNGKQFLPRESIHLECSTTSFPRYLTQWRRKWYLSDIPASPVRPTSSQRARVHIKCLTYIVYFYLSAWRYPN